MSMNISGSSSASDIAKALKTEQTSVKAMDKNLILPESKETRTDQATLLAKDIAQLGQVTGSKILSSEDKKFAADVMKRIDEGGVPSRSDVAHLQKIVGQAIKVLSHRAEDEGSMLRRVDRGPQKDFDQATTQVHDKFDMFNQWVGMQSDIVKTLKTPTDVKAFMESFDATVSTMGNALEDLKFRGGSRRYDELADKQIQKFNTLGKPDDPAKFRKALEKDLDKGLISSAEVEHLMRLNGMVNSAVAGRKESIGKLERQSVELAWSTWSGKDTALPEKLDKPSAKALCAGIKAQLDAHPEAITADSAELMKASLQQLRRAGFRDTTLEQRVALFQPQGPVDATPPTGMPEQSKLVKDMSSYLDTRAMKLQDSLDKRIEGLPEDSPQRKNLQDLSDVTTKIRYGTLKGQDALTALDALKGKDFGFSGVPKQLDAELRARVELGSIHDSMAKRSSLTFQDVVRLQTALDSVPGGPEFKGLAKELLGKLPELPLLTSTFTGRPGPVTKEDWENQGKSLDHQLQSDIKLVSATLFPDREAVNRLRDEISRTTGPEGVKAFDAGLEKETQRQKFLQRSLLTQALGLTFTPLNGREEQRFEMPLAATLSHGNRIHFRLSPDLQEKHGGYGFYNWLTTGSPQQDRTKPHTGDDTISQARSASSHTAKFGSDGAKEGKVKTGNFTNQFGVDLTFGGLGSTAPNGQPMGFGGIPYETAEDGSMHLSDHVQSGHVLVRPMHDEDSGWGSVLIGNEGCGPGKTDFWGKGHGIMEAFKSSTHDVSPSGGDKFDVLHKDGHTVPAKYEGMHVTLDDGKMRALMQISEQLDALPPAQQERFMTALLSSNQQDAEKLLRTQFPDAF